MFIQQRVICGNDSDGNAGDHHRAISVAWELRASGMWDGKGRIVIHRPHNLHQQLSLTPVMDWRAPEPGALPVKIHEGVKYLVADWDFEILPAEGE